MTQKRQLFESRFFLTALFFLPLCGFVLYAIFADRKFFILILAVLMFLSGLLLFLRRRLMSLRAEYGIHRQDFLEQANLLESDIKKEWQSVESLNKKMVDYGQLKVIAEKLNQSYSVQDTSRTLSSEVGRLFGQKDTTIILYLFQSRTGELGISASQKGLMEVNLKEKKGDLYDKWVVKNLQALLIEDSKNDFRFDLERVHTEDARLVRSLMSVPLMISNKAIGILRLDSPRPNFFQADKLRLLTTIADMGAVAIENAQLYEKIEDLAIRDSLTGLFLRRHFLDRLSHEMSRELRQHKDLSFLMIDLDYFKKYNDNYGHMAGDIVLKTLGFMLTDIFDAPGNMICRYGGEEFAIFLPECSKEDAVRQAEVLRKKIEGQAIMLRREKTKISVSIGVATFPEDGQLRDDLIEKADTALYEAKKKGRNRVCAA